MRKLLYIGVIAVAPLAVDAAVLKPDMASASSIFDATNYPAENTINGSGLTGLGTDVTEAHDDYQRNPGNHWTSARGTAPLDQWIEWGFDKPTSIGSIYIWNHRSNKIANNSGYEPTLFDLELLDAAGDSLLILDDVPLQPNNAYAQAFGFGAVYDSVARVRFDVEAVESSTTYTGLAEVAFDTTVVPIPGAFPLLASALAVLGVARIRRRGPQ